MVKGSWLRCLMVLFAAVLIAHPAFAAKGGDPVADAPEFDPVLAIQGLAMAGGAAALIWERMRRRR